MTCAKINTRGKNLYCCCAKISTREKNFLRYAKISTNKVYSLKNLVSQKTCFKNLENPSCIDLILTNCSGSFQNTGAFETELSDFHKLTFRVLKQYYLKQNPKVVFYRKYKKFRNDLFGSELENEFSNYDINNAEYD